MHKQLIEHATLQQLKDFTSDTLSMLKATDKHLYEQLEMSLYKEIYGCHFNEWMLAKATADMVNEDGTHGAHWTLDQTTSVAKQYSINFDRFNQYDWNYVMNMVYSDYYGVVSNDVSSYVKIAKRFLEDKDGKEGKAFYYYMTMSD